MTDVAFFFDGWTPIVRTIVVGVSMYVALVVFLRVSGSRSLSKMNAFDFVVTVAIGAAFGSTLTSRGVAFAEALTAFAVLLAMQFVVGWIQTQWPWFKHVVTNPPVLLYFRGTYLDGPMRRQRVVEEDLRTAAREQGVGSMDAVEAIVLESSGEISVVTSVGDASALGDLPPEERERLSEAGGTD